MVAEAPKPVTPGSAAVVEEPAKPVVAKPAPKPRKSSPYDDAIQANRGRIAKCAQEHGAPPPSARVVIDVTTTGKAKTITLEPRDLDSSPLGTCVKNVLAGARYPSAPAEMRVSVALKAS